MLISGNASWLLISQRVAPIAVDSIPVIATISPAIEFFTGTHANPSFVKSSLTLPCSLPSLVSSTTGWPRCTVPLFILPIKYLPK